MHETIEISIPISGDVADCRMEPVEDDGECYYSVTILYPYILNGFARSQVYCFDMKQDAATKQYRFDTTQSEIPDEVMALETELGRAIALSR